MSTRNLRWVAIVGPVAFWAALLLLRAYLFQEVHTLEADIFSLFLIALGASLFSVWIFAVVDNREAEIRRRTEQLSALHAAALSLTTELDLFVVLQKVVDLSRTLVNAKYGALGVLDEKGSQIQQFITSGITAEERARLGAPPQGRGLLGLLISEGVPIRVGEIKGHPRSVGFPPNHPPMHSLVGVPIKSKGRVIGDLYLTDKLADADGVETELTEFSSDDQDLLEKFATQAAIAIENAQLYRQTQQLAVLQERERFGMDLHDGVIQSIYAIGLMLEDGQLRLPTEPEEANTRITQAIHGLNDVIRDIRNYILDLRPQRFQGRDLARGLDELARDLRANTFLNVRLNTEEIEPGALSEEQTVEILHILQETLTNVRKHARASSVDITMSRRDDHVHLTIEDDGVGLDSVRIHNSTGHGLHNMRERAHALGAEIQVEPGSRGGTRMTLSVPLENGQEGGTGSRE
jgi:two-component system, NarL family, sensor histidine kinase DevS